MFYREVFFNTNFTNNVMFFTEYMKQVHPESFKQLEEDKVVVQALSKFRPGVKALQIELPEVQIQITSILKEKFSFLELRENILTNDGFIEYDILVTNKLTGKEFVIEIFGPTHFNVSSSYQISPTSLIGLDLKRSTQPVVIIPFFEWNELNTRAEKAEYLECLLKPLLSE